MNPLVRIAFIAFAALLTLPHAAASAQTRPATASAARVSLWDDVDGNAVLGSPGDVLRARTVTTDGTFAFDASGCSACGLVIDRLSGSAAATAQLGVALSIDGSAAATSAAMVWNDTALDGQLGNGSDLLLGTATSTEGPLTLPAALCITCGAIVVDWIGSGQDIDWIGSGQDIDSVGGAIVDWGGSGQDIDWGGSGDDIDWGGSGDDIDWGGSGDDIDWGGSGDDIDGSIAGR